MNVTAVCVAYWGFYKRSGEAVAINAPPDVLYPLVKQVHLPASVGVNRLTTVSQPENCPCPTAHCT